MSDNDIFVVVLSAIYMLACYHFYRVGKSAGRMEVIKEFNEESTEVQKRINLKLEQELAEKRVEMDRSITELSKALDQWEPEPADSEK